MKYSNFGAEFKSLRKSKGLALQKVAKKTKVACSGLSRWENNPRHNISLPTVQKCFALLGMAVVICPVIKTK